MPLPRRMPCLRARPRALRQAAQVHGREHLGRLGELDVAVLDDLDVVAPRVDEVEPAAGQDLGARLLERLAQRRAVVDDEAEVAVLVLGLRAAGGERDELIAHVDERHARAAAAQRELEQPAVEGERLVDVADLERDVVDADQTRLGGLGRSHGATRFEHLEVEDRRDDVVRHVDHLADAQVDRDARQDIGLLAASARARAPCSRSSRSARCARRASGPPTGSQRADLLAVDIGHVGRHLAACLQRQADRRIEFAGAIALSCAPPSKCGDLMSLPWPLRTSTRTVTRRPSRSRCRTPRRRLARNARRRRTGRSHR